MCQLKQKKITLSLALSPAMSEPNKLAGPEAASSMSGEP